MGHHHHHHEHEHKNMNRRVLMIAFLLTAIFAGLEVVYGVITQSLALLSEGVHMSSDAFSLLIAALAVWLATKKPTKSKNFGYRRAEPIAAFLNGLGLIAIPIIVMFESVRRFFTGGREILSKEMLIVAVIGLVINLIVAYILSRGEKDNINVKAAMLHIIADLLSSLSTIIVSLLIMFFDLTIVDAIASFIISVIILTGGWKITKESFNILMEGTPHRLNIDKMTEEIKSVAGILEIQDVKAWSIADGEDYMNIQIQIDDILNAKTILEEIKVIADNHHFKVAIQIN